MRFILGVIMALALFTLALVGVAFGQAPAAPTTTTLPSGTIVIKGAKPAPKTPKAVKATRPSAQTCRRVAAAVESSLVLALEAAYSGDQATAGTLLASAKKADHILALCGELSSQQVWGALRGALRYNLENKGE
jgi:hypothetical protein